MRASKDGTLFLVENPFTGNATISRSLNLHGVQKAPRWGTPTDARAAVEPEKWKVAKRMVLVREIRHRFETSATYAMTNPNEFEGDFKEMLLKVAATTSSALVRGEAVLTWLKDHPEDQWPVTFKQQSNWLTGKFDIVLATHDIAAYFNHNKLKTIHRPQSVAAKPHAKRVDVRPHSALLHLVYAKDVLLFQKLRVWGPDPKKVRLLSGDCAVCTAKKDYPLVDLTTDSEAGIPITPPEESPAVPVEEAPVVAPTPEAVVEVPAPEPTKASLEDDTK